MPTVSNAFSSKNGAVSVEKYISVLEALENSIVKKGSNYIVDTKVAKDYGLTDTEINNLKEFLEDSSNQQIEQTLNEVPEAKKQAEKGQTTSFHVADVTDRLKAALYAVFVTLCGVALAQEFISDMYTLGAHKACHSLGKKHPSIKKACKITGYW